MWSKQAAAADTRSNKSNMTSFRNKITNRKSSKNADNSSDASEASTDKQQPLNDAADKKKLQQQQQTKPAHQKTGRNRTRNKNKKEGAKVPDKKDDNKSKGAVDNNVKLEIEKADTEKIIDPVDDCDGVVLRHPGGTLRINNASSVKRYSDSFVLENQVAAAAEESAEKEKVTNPTPLTRALSGFFVLDQKKHSRRFSDLWRPVSNKFSGSTESLKIPIKLERNAPETMVKVEPKNETKDKKDKANKKAENAKKTLQAKSADTSKPAATESSYLKRVKSKIYKSKSDDCAKIELDSKYKKLKPKKSLDLNGRIPEEDVPSPTGPQKSLGPFHFGRLTRQTTNLERISRPFGSQKSVETAQSVGLERPVLAKSKSSSAINLSLLRTRRAKLLDQSTSAASLCKEEFDFIAFGGGEVKPASSTTSLHKFPSWLHLSKGEAKVPQPVSRSGSDRRPDAVREEGGRPVEDSNHLAEGALDHMDASSVEKKDANMSQESTSSLQSGGVKRRAGSHINRSESVKEQSEKIRKQQRRNISDPSHAHNTSYDGDDRKQDLSKHTDSGSSSNSSISAVNGRLSESPSTSMDVHQATVRTQSDSDSDMDGEADPLNWQELVTEEELKKLNPNEKKRQEVINELYLTEASHVRMLKVLYKLFYKSLYSSQLLKPEELNLLFPNIKELLDVHTEINKEMRRIRKEDPLVRQIGSVLVSTFTGPQGELLQRAAATFCERQQLALEYIKKKRERDNKLDSLLTECEKKRQCRRLQLQGIVPIEMQRLTRYPLLLERLIQSVEAAEKTCSEYKDELVTLRQAHQYSQETVSFVDKAAKAAHQKHRLEEIQKHLDVSNFRNNDHPIVYDFKNIDLTRYKLIREGGLQLRRPNKAPVQVHVLLMEEIVVILQKESEKFILKFFQSGSPAQPPLSPIIKMNTLLVRENAVCKSALFLVNTSTTSSQMYDLQAEDVAKREAWLKLFEDAATAFNHREGKPSRVGGGIPPINLEPVNDSDSESVRESEDSSTHAESETVAASEPGIVADSKEDQEEEEEGGSRPALDSVEASTEDAERQSSVEDPQAGGDDHTPDVTGGGGIHVTTRVSAEEWPLIQPSQVNVAVPPVHTAESMLTPLEQIRRKDALVKQALADKEDLVADMLAIPREHFEHIADMASAATSTGASDNHTSDVTDRLLASVFQVDLLQKAVNKALNISEAEVMAARGGKQSICASQDAANGANETRSVIPSVPAGLVGDIAASLNLQLTTLLSEVKQIEEERDRLRKELHKVREQLHEQHNLHSPVPFEDPVVSDESTQEVFCEAISDEPN